MDYYKIGQTGNMETKADWLRSEIEKLEGMKINDFGFIDVQLNGITHKVKAESDRHIFYNTALTSIITRYKEELKELESK